MTVIGVVFALLVAFQIKHWIADYPLQQNDFMLGKFKPGWGFFFPLLAHASVHAALTTLIATQAISTRGGHIHHWHGLIPVAWFIGAFDGTIHFFMDRIKAASRYLGRWKPITPGEYLQYRKEVDLTDDQCLADNGSFQEKFKARALARKALRGNSFFWVSLGFDQMVHHLTHYGCIYFILKASGVL